MAGILMKNGRKKKKLRHIGKFTKLKSMHSKTTMSDIKSGLHLGRK